MRRLIFSVLIVLLFAGFAKAQLTYNVTMNTAPLVGQGTFKLDLQLVDGSGISSDPNSVMLNNFDFGAGGGPSGNGVPTNGATGSLAAGVTLKDQAFLNEYIEGFTPGSSLSFTITVTNVPDSGGAPDLFTMAILDSNGNEIPTTGFGNEFLSFSLEGGAAPKISASGSAPSAKSAVDAPSAVPNAPPTPPVTTATISPPPSAAEWNNTNVTVTLNSTDNGAGGTAVKQITYSAAGAQTITSTVVSGASTTFTISTEGITTISFFGTDNAANSEAAKTLTIQLDKTPPTITGSRTPPPNVNGWNNTNVTVNFQCADSLSGLAAGSPPTPTILSTDGAAQSVSGTCTDIAGNSLSSTISSINIDKTSPSVNCGAPDGLWHGSDVTIACTAASDAGSGLVNPSDAAFSLSTSVTAGTETSNAATGTHSVCDLAGNCATSGPITGNMVDKKPPTISISSPTAAGSYQLNQAVNANYTCTDGGSGVATCTGTIPSGFPIGAASVGSKTFTVNATDKVGNVAPPQSVSYSITYAVCLLYDPTRAVQSGSTIPLKIQLCDANNADVSVSAVVVHAISLVQTSTNASEVLQASGNANPDNDFRFDPSLGPTGGYIFNLSTKGLTTGSYQLTFIAGADPSPHVLSFQVR